MQQRLFVVQMVLVLMRLKAVFMELQGEVEIRCRVAYFGFRPATI